ncbi:ligand-binding sensor domain-containing protein [Alistipes sp.]|uniref:ligand-binding sensor domain-containing protein n=1 Tax=Alistipes sp. TaxID=1872444 RepID=UPI003AB8F2A9
MKRTFRCIAAFLFLLYTLFLPGRADSANAPVYHNLRSYTVDDGLSSNHVYGIVQDSVGFIWFGTDNGLCRFDGREFRSYTHTDGDRSSISSNNIRRLMLDSRGQIWLALDNGVDIYTPATDRFRHFDARTADGAFVAGQTTEVIEDRGGGNLDCDRQFGTFPLESRNGTTHGLPPSSQ